MPGCVLRKCVVDIHKKQLREIARAQSEVVPQGRTGIGKHPV